MPYEDTVYFLFSIPNKRRGTAQHDLNKLFGKIVDAKITLRAISGSASGRKMKIFCVPEDTDKFRDFLQSAGLRARERNAYSITGEYQVNGVMKVISKLALAPVNIRAFDAMSISGKEAGGFVLSHDKT